MTPSCIQPEESTLTYSVPSKFWFDFLDELPEIADTTKWFADGLIVDSGLNMVCAAPGAGKSLLDLAHSCTHNRSFLGLFDVPQTNVLIVDQDSMNPKEQNKRILNFGFEADRGLFRMNQQSLKISEIEHMNWLAAECKKHDVRLVIFDSLVRFHSGDEYSPQQLSILRDNLQLLTLEGITVVILHHNSRNGKYRGSSEIASWCDSMLGLTKISGPVDHFILTIEKNRTLSESDPFQSIGFIASKHDGTTRLQGVKSNAPLDPIIQLKRRILDLCEGSTGKTKSEIREACTCDTSKTDRAIAELLEDVPGLRMLKKGNKKIYISIFELPDAEDCEIDEEDEEFVGSSSIAQSTNWGAA